jgi:hypothetical protein
MVLCFISRDRSLSSVFVLKLMQDVRKVGGGVCYGEVFVNVLR